MPDRNQKKHVNANTKVKDFIKQLVGKNPSEQAELINSFGSVLKPYQLEKALSKINLHSKR